MLKPEAKIESALIDWLRLIRTENVGPVTFYQLLERYGSAGAALEVLPEKARQAGRAKPLFIPYPAVIEKEIVALHKHGGRFITAADPSYPLALSALPDAPPVLAALGNIDLLNQDTLAIVGARNASLTGRKCAARLARELGEAGQIIASGLARGIDTAAHEGALESGTVAVVAGGIDVVYPPENQKLYEEIAEKGLILAESPLGQKPFAQSFPRRNRIVSGLSSGVVVIEATMRSGSLITARLAAEQGRDVYAVPGHPDDPRAAGPNHLIRDGAALVRHAQDILEGLSSFAPRPKQKTPYIAEAGQPPIDVPDESEIRDIQAALQDHLSGTPVQTDELIRALNLPAAAVNTALLDMELAGLIERHPGNRISAISA